MIRNINRNRASEMNGNRSSEMVVNIQSALLEGKHFFSL
jgi:hypothetical protein